MVVDMKDDVDVTVEVCLNVIEGDFILDKDIAANGRISEIDIADGDGGHIRIFGGKRPVDEIIAEAREKAETYSCTDASVRHFQKHTQYTISGEPYTLYYICINY